VRSLLNTKMLYHHDSRNRSEMSKKVMTLIVLVAVSVLVLLVTPIRNVLTQGVYLIAPEMWAAGSMASEKWNSVASNFHDKAALSSENAALRVEINRMQAEMLDRNLLAERVASLEGTLGRVKSDDRVVASVVVDSKHSPYDVLVVDAGTDNGVSAGNKVVLAGSGVIGEVVEASMGTAKVSLYSTPGVETSAVVGIHSVPIVALGRGMGNYEAKVPEGTLDRKSVV
jgi:cell shape-determining protein MreC